MFLAPPDPHWKTAVYHCQQAAEKAAKALLVQHDGMLLKKLERHDIGIDRYTLRLDVVVSWKRMERVAKAIGIL